MKHPLSKAMADRNEPFKSSRMRLPAFVARALLALMLISLCSSVWSTAWAAGSGQNQAASEAGVQPYYVIPVQQTIESGLYQFLKRAFKAADEANAKAIILDIDTLGGRVDAALDIGALIRDSRIPTAAYIRGKAASAGSYIALNANKIVMAPGSSIGAAAVVDSSGKEVESPKTIEFWSSEMRSAAELRGRDPQIAGKMVDKNKVVTVGAINRTYGPGEIASLSTEEAIKAGYADAVAGSVEEAARFMAGPSSSNPNLVTVKPTFAEKLARYLTSPYVMPILLLIGIAGVAIELFVPGFGLPGIIGILGFGLYFFGHYVAGFAGVEDVALFVAGIVLLVIEVFLPTFGIIGIAGVVCIICGVVLAAYDTQNALWSLGIAFAIAIVVVGVFIKYFKHRGIWNRFILREEQKNELGYTSTSSKEHLLGKKGKAMTPLRPAGAANIDGERVDVVTGGEFIERGRPIEVVKIEGARVVVLESQE